MAELSFKELIKQILSMPARGILDHEFAMNLHLWSTTCGYFVNRCKFHLGNLAEEVDSCRQKYCRKDIFNSNFVEDFQND
ncbi:hypothetical protein MTR_4g065133 [Medicago truncatula]|uniref:Uncharacterized protein n=1 Tax=Medicago truncatula TaxID=3880 RepID=A0A072UKF3_MEDTR|nr:hypothetical protein MTR_4g065133 [Medicago truncatula]